MLKLKVRRKSEGLHPSELMVEIETATGKKENLLIDSNSLNDNKIDVGYAVGHNESGSMLVELPRETMSGAWRVWVTKDELEGVTA